jgi:hypothetical protein
MTSAQQAKADALAKKRETRKSSGVKQIRK